MNFKDPWVLVLIPIAIIFVVWLQEKQKEPSLRFPSLGLLSGTPVTWKNRLLGLPRMLRAASLILFLLALAGPQRVLEETRHTAEGIDIVLAIDSSGSMAAEDFKINEKRYNRLEVVKNVVQDFIKARHADRIGLVAFAKQAYTVCPLTTDYDWLLANLQRVTLGILDDGTAVGSAISSSLSRLEKSTAKSRVVILLTDGINNTGKIDPLTAARAAQALGIKIYTIGAGTTGYAPFPAVDFWGRKVYQKVQIEIDEATLQKIAELTGAQYFRATDTESLRRIYGEIDKLEKTKIEEFGYKEYRQLFGYFLTAALLLLFLEAVLSNTIFLKVP